MINDLQLIAEDGVTYALLGRQGPVHMVYLDGVGLPSVRRILEKSPLRDGAVDRGFRLEPRQMTLSLYLDGLDEQQTDDLRDGLAKIFSPTDTPLKLRATRKDGEIRQIDCYLNGLLDFPGSARMGKGQPVTIPILAPDPTWYYPTQQTVTIAGLAVGTIPLADYTADDWPIIDMTGPITNPSIEHGAGGSIENLTIVGSIPGGETWRFDLRSGYKTLRRTSDDANRMSYMNTATISAFSTMRILGTKAAQAQYAGAPSNTFTITGSGTTGATSTVIYWYKRYLSL